MVGIFLKRGGNTSMNFFMDSEDLEAYFPHRSGLFFILWSNGGKMPRLVFIGWKDLGWGSER